MFKRYPHTATLVTIVETDSTDGISGETETSTNIKGRFEPAGQSENLNYRAKYYCATTDDAVFSVDGQKLVYEGKTFTIAQLHNYQSHCELWLD